MMVNAPIALFTFNRPDHTRRTLESLAKNPEFQSSHLFVYCDGARHESDVAAVEATRKLVRGWPHFNKTVVEREDNWGLANSLIAGVTQLCNRFDCVIVVEDDLVVSPVFLRYMNSALACYAEEPNVMQVSGYMFPVAYGRDELAIMLPITSTWGWATWNRAWKQFSVLEFQNVDFLSDSKRRRAFNLHNAYPYTRRLRQQLRGRSDSWGISWYLTVFNCAGVVVYPIKSLVNNIGHDGSGTHCGIEVKVEDIVELSNSCMFVFPKDIAVSEDVFYEVRNYLRKENKLISRCIIKYKTVFIKLRKSFFRRF